MRRKFFFYPKFALFAAFKALFHAPNFLCVSSERKMEENVKNSDKSGKNC
jgi:hypothetical protein